ncbi:MAG: hypothetical protein HYS13_10450 [Planctomycetia bacterium]|nr:hypothetical protein [Planctomycetia bacterium]
MGLLATITLLDRERKQVIELPVLIPAASLDPLRDAIAEAARRHPSGELKHIEFSLPKREAASAPAAAA